MLTCRELLEFLSDYRDGSLAPELRQRFEQHLAACPDCVAYLESYERASELARLALREPDGTAEAEAPSDLVAAVLSSLRRS